MSKKRQYHRERCISSVRATITDKWGRTISLMGQHAFEWSIVIESCGRIIIQSYPSGKEARQAFYSLNKKR